MGSLKMQPERKATRTITHTQGFLEYTHCNNISLQRLNISQSHTYKDASTYAEADSYTHACSLVTTLTCGFHVFELTLKVKGVY